jgi:exopolysaccharide production protein ExoZ
MKTFTSIQHLRGIAALMVVAFHLLQPARGIVFPAWTSFAGAAGVDIFFVISGFIIYVSQNAETPQGGAKAAADFARRRAARILPMYWLFTTVLVALHLTVHLNADLSLQPAHVWKSLLLVPHFSPSAPDRIEPLLVPGWTLQYELFFYALFALGVWFLNRRRVFWMSAMLVGLVTAGALLHPAGAVGISYTSPRLLEFLAGVLLGVAARTKPALFPTWGWIGAPVGFGLLLATDFAGPAWGSFWREAWGWGPPAVLVVFAALCLDLNRRALVAPLLKTLGDASYSIYLTHLITLGVVRQGWRLVVHPSPDPMVFFVFCTLAFLAATAAGVGVYQLVERPLLRRMSGLLAPRAAPEPTVPLNA